MDQVRTAALELIARLAQVRRRLLQHLLPASSVERHSHHARRHATRLGGGEIVAREAFRSQLDAYVDAHCSEFDNSDENKLECAAQFGATRPRV